MQTLSTITAGYNTNGSKNLQDFIFALVFLYHRSGKFHHKVNFFRSMFTKLKITKAFKNRFLYLYKLHFE